MQVETLTQLKRQINLLDADSKKHLAEFLSDELDAERIEAVSRTSDADRAAQTEWLKINRERFANRYVALSGSDLVGQGTTYAEAKAAAEVDGHHNVFVTYVYSENEEVFGGW